MMRQRFSPLSSRHNYIGWFVHVHV